MFEITNNPQQRRSCSMLPNPRRPASDDLRSMAHAAHIGFAECHGSANESPENLIALRVRIGAHWPLIWYREGMLLTSPHTLAPKIIQPPSNSPSTLPSDCGLAPCATALLAAALTHAHIITPSKRQALRCFPHGLKMSQGACAGHKVCTVFSALHLSFFIPLDRTTEHTSEMLSSRSSGQETGWKSTHTPLLSKIPLPQTVYTSSRHRFPSELLLEVFKVLAAPVDISDDFYAHWTYPGFIDNWLSITIVCRRWRRLACSNSTLWSTVVVYNHYEWLDVVLPRSGLRPVDIVFHRTDSVPSCLDIVKTHSSRIRKLFFPSFDLPSYTSLLSLSTVPMLALEHVQCGRWSNTVMDSLIGRFTLDHSHFPALTIFRCASLQLDWEAPIVRQVTTLSIMDAPVLPAGYTFNDFLDLLEQLSEGPLRHLELCNAFPYALNTTPTPPAFVRAVALPKLLSLFLAHNRPAIMLALLSCLHLSSTVDVHIQVSAAAGDGGVDALLGLFDILPSDPRCLPIYGQASYGLLSAQRSATQPFDQIRLTCRTVDRMGGKLSVELSVADSGPEEWLYNFTDALEDFAALFGTSKLESLELSIEDTLTVHGEAGSGDPVAPKHHITTAGFLKMFTTFPHITSLGVRVLDMQWSCPMALADALWGCCKYGYELSEAVETTPDGGIQGGTPIFKFDCPLPCLQTLRLEECGFNLEFLRSLLPWLWGRHGFFHLPLQEVFIELVQLPPPDTSSLVFCTLMRQYKEVVEQVKVLFHLPHGMPVPDSPLFTGFMATAPVFTYTTS